MSGETADKSFRWLCWAALPAYPAAVYCAWGCTLVDHEVPPLQLFACTPVFALGLHGSGFLFCGNLGPTLLSWRRQAGDPADAQRYLARAWKIVEVVCLSMLGWLVLRKEPFFPASLGGAGDSEAMFPSGRRFVSASLAMYHAVRFAYLLEWWVFQDGLQRPSLTMHHIATSVLLCCAVLLGWTKIGSIVVFIHDVWNVPLQILLLIQQVKCSSAWTIVAYVVSLYTSFHLLFYCFGAEVIYASFSRSRAATAEWKVYWVMFALLLIHHVHAVWRLLLYIPRFLKSPGGALARAQEREGTHRD